MAKVLTMLDDAMLQESPSQLLRLLPGHHLTLRHQPVHELGRHQRPLVGPTLLLPCLQQAVFRVHQSAHRNKTI